MFENAYISGSPRQSAENESFRGTDQEMLRFAAYFSVSCWMSEVPLDVTTHASERR
jgi:hypothetical protein